MSRAFQPDSAPPTVSTSRRWRQVISPATLGRWIRYAVVGGAGTVLYMAMVVALVELIALSPVVSAVIAFIFTDIIIYVLNRWWVFASQQRHRRAFPRFFAVSLIGLALNAGIMYATVNMLDLWYAAGLIGATAIVPPTNYLLNAYWCFK